MQTTAIITVKRLDSAKERLSQALGRGARAALAQAMFSDVLAAVGHCAAIERTMVVTSDARVKEIALSMGVETIEDTDEAGQSAAAGLGIARASALGAEAVVLLPGDCPLLDAGELDELLSRSQADGVLIVCDRHGTGTNGLVLRPPSAIEPAFGEGSCARHAALARTAGLPFAVERVPSLGLDVDTPDDLDALRRALTGVRGRGARTQGIVSQMSQIAPDGQAPPPRVVA